MVVAITELRIRNIWGYLLFMPHAIKSKIQADKSNGIISIELKPEGLFIQRTLTTWQDQASMNNYYRSGAHLKAMKAFKKIALTSYSASYESENIPSWDEAIKYLRAYGKIHHN